MSNPRTSQRFIVDESCPEVLVSALKHWLPHLSWSKVRNLMRSRRIAVGDALCLHEGRKLSAGEWVDVFENSLPVPPDERDVHVIYCDRDIVVVEKPARMLTLRHRAESNWHQWQKDQQPTLEEVIPHLIYSAERTDRPPLFSVHRIDRDTSGLLVFARSESTQQALIEQFARHDVVRVYRAIIPGELQEQTVRSNLIRDRGDGLRGSRVTGEGIEAVTHFQPMRTIRSPGTNSVYSELECRLETGRTHQIRIQLAELGHPVCGDLKYRAAYGVAPIEDISGAPRMALHAAQLGLTHPTKNEVLHFKTEWDVEMSRFLDRLQGVETKQMKRSTPKKKTANQRLGRRPRNRDRRALDHRNNAASTTQVDGNEFE